MIEFSDIQQAAKRIEGIAHKTPVLHSRQFDERAGCTVFFKAENLQRGGAFKFRGACNKIKAELEKGPLKSVAAFSSGNHAQAVALNAMLLKIPAVIVMPHDAPQTKIEATRGYGAEVVLYDRYKEDREKIGRQIAKERNALLIPPFDDPLIMAGQGTAALELLQEVPDLDFLLTPMSGGGLMAGSAVAAKHLRPKISLMGVEPENGNDTYLSFQRGSRVTIEVPKTIADGLQTPAPGELTFPINRELVEKILLVSDSELVKTMIFILERMKVLVEPSGVAAAAAVLTKKSDFQNGRVGVILSGGNIDLNSVAIYLND
jgi:threo-3-hydroxy-L-aspartate ammonia-lyase